MQNLINLIERGAMLGNHDVVAVVAVKDMDVAAKFYGETLGLSAGMDVPGGKFYESGKSGIFVYPSEFAGTNKATAATWNVEDIAGVVAELKAKGVEFEHYDMPGMSLDGDIHVMGDLKSAWFTDPDGNILNIVNQ